MADVVYNGRLEDIATHSFLKHVFGDSYQHINRYGFTGPNHINFWTCKQWWDNSDTMNYIYSIDFRNDVYSIRDNRMDSKLHGLEMCKRSFFMNTLDFKNATGDLDNTTRNNPNGNKLYWEIGNNHNLKNKINYINDDFSSITFEITVYDKNQYNVTKLSPIKFVNKDRKLLENVYLNFLDNDIFITIVVLKDDNDVYAYNIYAGDDQDYTKNFKFFQNDDLRMNIKITIEN